MHFTKKWFRRPLYKKLLPLRKNINDSEKILTFKKQKWQRFRHQILKYNKKKFYDSMSYVLFNFNNFFSKKFKYNLQNKQRLSFFYGRLSKSYLKKLVGVTLKNSKNTKTHMTKYFLECLETRLDSALYRAHFCSSFNSARQLISHKKVYVNNKIVQHPTYILKKGDLITLDKSVHNFIVSNTLKSKVWPIYPKHFQVNYRTLQILMIEDIKYSSHLINYPFWIDFNSFLQSYKK